MGATIELPKQSAKQSGFGPVALGALLVVVIAMAAVLIAANLSSRTSAVDRSYDQIEGLRGATTLSATDTSVNAVEGIRGGAFAPAPVDASGWKFVDPRGTEVQPVQEIRGWTVQPPREYSGSWLDNDDRLLDGLKSGAFLPHGGMR
jgi:hypothetical protein